MDERESVSLVALLSCCLVSAFLDGPMARRQSICILRPMGNSFWRGGFYLATAGTCVGGREGRGADPDRAFGEWGVGGAYWHADAPGLDDGSQQLLLLLAQGICNEQGQGVEAGCEVLQLGLQAADLLL